MQNLLSRLFQGHTRKSPGEYINDIFSFIKWLFLGAGIGVILGGVGSFFWHTLVKANNLREQYPWVLYLLPLGGLFVVFLYRICKNTSDKGVNTVMASIQESADIPSKMAPLIFIGTSVTQLCGGSAGREGAALQLGASISKTLGRLLHLQEDDQRILVLCGMSAGFSALFGTPLAAAVFPMEAVNVGIMQYGAFVPCVAASLAAYLMAGQFGVQPDLFSVSGIPVLSLSLLLKIIVLAAAAGFISLVFCLLLHGTEYLFESLLKNQYVRIALAGCILILLTWLLNTREYLGSGMGIIEQVFSGKEPPWYAFLIKMLFTAITLGAGFKGGEIVPSFSVGAALGCALSPLLGVPAELAAACGMVGLFCGVTNSPIAALLIGFEIFGFQGMPYYLITIAVSYVFSGYEGLYRRQKILFSKHETGFANHAEEDALH